MTALYSQHFDRAVNYTLGQEGVFSNHSWDPGGKTKYGITEKLARRYNRDVESLTIEQAKAIYHSEFWRWPFTSLDPIAEINFDVAAELFDTAVNCGLYRAVRILQEALSTIFDRQEITIDGVFGSASYKALVEVSRKYPRQLLGALNGFQFAYYLHLLRMGHPAAKKAIKGWMLRLDTDK